MSYPVRPPLPYSQLGAALAQSESICTARLRAGRCRTAPLLLRPWHHPISEKFLPAGPPSYEMSFRGLATKLAPKGKVVEARLKVGQSRLNSRDRSGNTWAGRGAQPTWLREKLKAGAKLEDFAVHKTAASPRPPPRNPRNVAGLNAERVASSVSGIFLMVARQTVQLTELAYEPSQPRY